MKLLKYLTFALFPILAACGRESTFEWKEEVQLQDGRVIVVTQKRRYERVYDGHSTGDVEREAWLKFSLPETENKEVIWNERAIPMILNSFNNQIYLIATYPTWSEWNRDGKPLSFYKCFQLKNRKWIKVDIKDIPPDIYEGNLLIGSKPKNEIKFVDLKYKALEKKDPRNEIPKKYKFINPQEKFNN